MRKLNTADVFSLCRVVKATGAREAIQPIVAKAAKAKEAGETIDVTDIGVDAILAIMEAAVEPSAEKLIYSFLAGPLECKPTDVAAMPVTELIGKLKELAGENDLASFFDSASGVIGPT